LAVTSQTYEARWLKLLVGLAQCCGQVVHTPHGPAGGHSVPIGVGLRLTALWRTRRPAIYGSPPCPWRAT